MHEDHALELARSKEARVEPVLPPDRWRVSTDSRVGVISGKGWELRIRPRLEVPKLLFMLSYSLRPEGWLNVEAGFEEQDDLLDAIASGFSWHAEQALERGILHGYVHVEEREAAVRGRIRFGDQIARSSGLPLPLEIAYDDYTADVLENRLLLTAAEILLRLPRIPPQARKRLLHMRALLDDVSPLRETRGVKAPRITRLNERYAPAMTLALLVLRARSTALERGNVASTTFLFDMNEVFESFLFAALGDSFRRHGGRLERHHVAHLDHELGIRLEPDITWHRGGRCRAVVDAKYKSLVDKKTMPNADAYQMLAYCIALGLPRGFLIYAKDAGERTRDHTIRQHGYEIVVRAVDVEKEPRELLAEIGRLADEIAAVPVARAA